MASSPIDLLMNAGRPEPGQPPPEPLFEQIPVGCLLLDCEDVVRGINRPGARMLGDVRERFVGHEIVRFVGRRSRQTLLRHLHAVRSLGGPHSCDVETWCGGSRGVRWMRLRSHRVRAWWPPGDAVLSIAMGIDDLVGPRGMAPRHSGMLFGPRPGRGRGSAMVAGAVLGGRTPGAAGSTDSPACGARSGAGLGRRMPQGACGRVLVVDDEALMLSSTSRMLRRIGYEPVSCRAPVEALERFEEAPGAFAVVVTDYKMPGMNGIELSRRLHVVRQDVPILLVSGSVAEFDRSELDLAGIGRALTKPVEIGDFMESLWELTTRA
jgi:CheY-like chemotaxis protein